jgi:hypothetical protein
MRARLQIDGRQINSMDLTIAVTMEVQQWRGLLKQLNVEHPSSQLSLIVRDALDHVTRATDSTLDTNGYQREATTP